MRFIALLVALTLMAVMLAALLPGCGAGTTPASAPADTPATPIAAATSSTTIAPAPASTPVAPQSSPTSAPAPTSTPTATATPAPPTPEPTPSLFPITITDSNGNDITFDAPPERIIAFDSAAVEILYALGEQGRIAGTHTFVDYPPETANIPRVGDAFNLDFEQVVAQDPDLVYIFFDRFVPELQGLGLKVLYIKSLSDDLEQTMEHFRLWGRIIGNPEAASDQISEIQARIQSIEESLADVEQGPRVYHHGFDFWTPGGNTLMARIYELLKADLVTSDLEDYVQISPEELVLRDPQIIVTSEFNQQQVLDSDALAETTAVKNGAVVLTGRGSLDVAGTRLMDAIEELAELLYPDRFSTGSSS